MQFYVVYIREAHPSDGWQLYINETESVIFAQPQTQDAREAVAQACSLDMAWSIPTLVDEMDDAVDKAYAALPDRLYLIDAAGRVAYRGERGPMGFRPKELETAIQTLLAAEPQVPAT